MPLERTTDPAGVAPVPATETVTLRLCAAVMIEAAGLTVTVGVVGFDEPPPPPPPLPDPPPQLVTARIDIAIIEIPKKKAGLFRLRNPAPFPIKTVDTTPKAFCTAQQDR